MVRRQNARRANAGQRSCPYCFVLVDSVEGHRDTNRHILNYKLDHFSRGRKDYTKNKHDTEVRVVWGDTMEIVKKGKTIHQINVEHKEQTITLQLQVVNKHHTEDTLILEAGRLLNYPAFRLSDTENFIESSPTIGPPALAIGPGVQYTVNVQFTNMGEGHYRMPVHFRFRVKRGKKDYSIVRELDVVVKGAEELLPTATAEEDESSPYTGETWGEIKEFVPGTDRRGNPLKQNRAFSIPQDLKQILVHNLTHFEGITTEQEITLVDVVSEYVNISGSTKEVTEHNYDKYWRNLLYLEEQETKNSISKYNMIGVRVTVLQDGQVTLKVPGLAEKRPSVLRGDLIYMRDTEDKEVQYEGEVKEVGENTITISGLNPGFVKKLMRENVLVDVHFSFSRYSLVVQHETLRNVSTEVKKMLFMKTAPPPSPALLSTKDVANVAMFNSAIENNKEQRQAVLNILLGVNMPAPYILFGPPGTGKTVTLVEAILQIRRWFPSRTILVCAPSNAACDHVAGMLLQSQQCDQQEILRYMSANRSPAEVPDNIRPICKTTEQMDKKELKKYKILVTTLITAHRMVKWHSFSHIIIDEAGQASEPETLVGFSGLLLPYVKGMAQGQLVLAGDPKQLGPVCVGPKSSTLGLNLSLMERMMASLPMYQPADLVYNERFITKLVNNFRSHSEIIKFSNEHFYAGQLVAKAEADPLSTAVVASNIPGGPVLFHGVMGKEQKEGRSPSFFNSDELSLVVKYVQSLLCLNISPPVKHEDIGVISPYMRQVYKIKQEFQKRKWNNIEVGTTEVFQGREKRAIIVSCVRSQINLIEHDKKFKLGFLKDPKRLNVMMTRAKAKLIVIGNPSLLVHDPIWHAFIKQRKDTNSYVGVPFVVRDDEWVDEMLSKFQFVGLNDL